MSFRREFVAYISSSLVSFRLLLFLPLLLSRRSLRYFILEVFQPRKIGKQCDHEEFLLYRAKGGVYMCVAVLLAF